MLFEDDDVGVGNGLVAVARWASRASAGGQLEQPSEVKSSTRTGVRGVWAGSIGGKLQAPGRIGERGEWNIMQVPLRIGRVAPIDGEALIFVKESRGGGSA